MSNLWVPFDQRERWGDSLMAGGRVPSARQGQMSELQESLELTRESFWSARSHLDGLLYWNVCHDP